MFEHEQVPDLRELKFKSDAAPASQHLVRERETLFHHEHSVAQCVCSVEGGDFEKRELLALYGSNGI
jgi:hypothetical protein